jgi:hypothetical protein
MGGPFLPPFHLPVPKSFPLDDPPDILTPVSLVFDVRIIHPAICTYRPMQVYNMKSLYQSILKSLYGNTLKNLHKNTLKSLFQFIHLFSDWTTHVAINILVCS